MAPTRNACRCKSYCNSFCTTNSWHGLNGYFSKADNHAQEISCFILFKQSGLDKLIKGPPPPLKPCPLKCNPRFIMAPCSPGRNAVPMAALLAGQGGAIGARLTDGPTSGCPGPSPGLLDPPNRIDLKPAQRTLNSRNVHRNQKSDLPGCRSLVAT